MLREGTPTVSFECAVQRVTPKALLIKIEDHLAMWVPKSQISFTSEINDTSQEGDTGSIEMSEWIAGERMFRVGNGFKLSVRPFEIPPSSAQAFPDTDAALRERVADLTAKLAKVMEENADMKAQLTQESQDAINKQVIIDGLRSERARHTAQLADLTAKLAALQLHWSTKKPTVPGWYWYRPVGLPMRPKELFDYNGRLFVRGFEWLDTITNGEWAGPLVPPKEET